VINQHGNVRTIIPDVTAHFEDEMIILEKWIPNKPISAIYWDGEKERYYGKRFLLENPEKDEVFISEHENSQLEIVSTDYRPVAEMVFYKERGKDQKENEVVSMEDFISIKGVKAQGNQFYAGKLKQVNWLESLPYEAPVAVPKEEIEVVDDITVTNESKPASETKGSSKSSDDDKEPPKLDDEGQALLF